MKTRIFSHCIGFFFSLLIMQTLHARGSTIFTKKNTGDCTAVAMTIFWEKMAAQHTVVNTVISPMMYGDNSFASRLCNTEDCRAIVTNDEKRCTTSGCRFIVLGKRIQASNKSKATKKAEIKRLRQQHKASLQGEALVTGDEDDCGSSSSCLPMVRGTPSQCPNVNLAEDWQKSLGKEEKA